MSGSDRSLLAPAIFGLIVFSAIGGYMLAPVSGGYQQHKAASSADSAAQPTGNPVFGPFVAAERFFERQIAKPEAPNESRHDARDLAAQEGMAFWAFWVTLIGALQLVLSGFGLWALIKTIRQGDEALREARKANQVARDSMVTQNRAWVSIEPRIISGLTWQDGYGVFFAEAEAKNLGSTVALEVSITMRAYVTRGTDIPSAGARLKEAIAAAKVPLPELRSRNLFPDQTTPTDSYQQLTIQGGVSPFPENDSEIFRITPTCLVAVARYRTIFDPPGSYRVTAAVYELQVDGDMGPITGKDVPEGALYLRTNWSEYGEHID